MLQDAKLSPADYRGDLIQDHPQDVTGDPTCSKPYPPAFQSIDRTPTGICGGATSPPRIPVFSDEHTGAQADYGLESLVRDMTYGGPTGAAGGRRVRRSFVAGSIGPLNWTLSLSRGGRPVLRAVTSTRSGRRTREQITALARARRPACSSRRSSITLNAKAAIAAARTSPRSCRSGSP